MSEPMGEHLADLGPIQARSEAKRAPEIRPEDLTQFLREHLARPVTRPGLETVVMPLPRRFDAIAILASLRGVDAWYLRTGATEMLGLGSVRRIEPSGPHRFAAAREAIAGWAAETTTVRHPAASEREVRGPSQRAFVGFAFAPGPIEQPEMWQPFGDAVAVLPRWTLIQSSSASGGGALELTLDRAGRGTGQLEAILAELAELLSVERPPVTEPATVSVDHEPPEVHRARVAAALEEIEAGHLGKVVVARRTAIFGARDLDATRALQHFCGRGDEGTVYFVRRGGSVLLGVTPERLLSVRDHALETEALAGTAAEGQAEQLRASKKDREEHRFVVASIEESLAPLVSRIKVAAAPEVASAGSVVHLKTKITATLREGIHPLEVAAALHPTPAVGGTPKIAATEWIARTEPERGWYGGPLGWVDASGDGELFVALRGGVIRGACAWAFAGGGIVRGSVPDAELEEAILKVGGFLRALGAH